VGKLQLRIFDGSRQLFSTATKFLVTITDGNQTQHVRDYFRDNDITFDLPFFDNLGDEYRVVVWAEGYKQAGFAPVKLSDNYLKRLDIMLVSDDAGFSFADAPWATANARYPFIGGDLDDAAGATRYEDFMEASQRPLACLLNLGEAMSQIALSQGTPLDYIKQMRWNAAYAPAQDRFFAWCDARLIDQVKIAAAANEFAVENNPGLFHPGATSSWKQIQFGEANVQLTFHENEKLVIGGVDCVMVEPDIDYYQDLAAHTIFEVIPNALTHSLTDPIEVYVLRWIAGRTQGIPEFAPLYTVTA
jgi:hypothetical protein